MKITIVLCLSTVGSSRKRIVRNMNTTQNVHVSLTYISLQRMTLYKQKMIPLFKMAYTGVGEMI
jgi:hypothetical protein